MSSIPAHPGASGWTITFDRTSQIKAALVGAAFIALFWPVLMVLQYQWRSSADWSHGPIIPLFSAYLVYLYWDDLKRTPIRHAWVGGVVMIAGLLIYQYNLWLLHIGYLGPASMLLTLLGVVIWLCGVPAMRWLTVPWAYLFFAVPLPKRTYLDLTDPMREWAASAATWTLNLFPDLHIERIGSIIAYEYFSSVGRLGVEDACSGMRSAITMCALGVAVAFMAPRPAWHRLVLLAACVPIAILSNFVRVITTCILHIFVDPRYATGTYHTLLGLATLLIAFVIFNWLAWVLQNLVIEDEEGDEPDEAATRRPEARPEATS